MSARRAVGRPLPALLAIVLVAAAVPSDGTVDRGPDAARPAAMGAAPAPARDVPATPRPEHRRPDSRRVSMRDVTLLLLFLGTALRPGN